MTAVATFQTPTAQVLTTEAAPAFRLPELSPHQVAEHGLQKYENNLAMRLINAAFHASLHASKPEHSHWRPRHVVVRLVGPAGVGKTAAVESYCRQEGLAYAKLDCQVTDIAEVFGMKTPAKVGDRIETVSALPPWWPRTGVPTIVNVDDLSRGLPHIQQAMQQFIMEREFNGVRLPDTACIVITDNPDTADYHVSSLDVAQLTRMISVPWNPPADIEFEQLVKQEVHDDLKNFWMGNPELCKVQPVTIDPVPTNPRVRMIFNRIYPYIKFDPGLLNFVGSSMFGATFMTTFKAYLSSEQPISPTDILTGVPYADRLKKYVDAGRQDLVSLTISRLMQELRSRARISRDEFKFVGDLLMRVPVDAGGTAIRQLVNANNQFGDRMIGMISTNPELVTRYKEYMDGVRDKLQAAQAANP